MVFGLILDAVSIVLVVSLTVLMAVRRPPEPLWPSFFLVLLAVSVWAVGETFAQFLAPDPAAHRFWVLVLYSGAILLAPSWFCAGLAFTRHVRVPLAWDTRTVRRIPIVLAVIYWLGLVTSSWHGQFITPNLEGKNEYHFLWYAHIATTYAILVGSIVVFIHLFRHLSAPVLRQQVQLLTLGASIPLLANFLFLTGILPSNFDPTVAAMAVTAVLFFAAIYPWQAFPLSPFNLQNLLEFEDDVCLILDHHGRVVAHSRPAESFFGPEKLHPNCDGFDLLAGQLKFPGGEACPERAEFQRSLQSSSRSINVIRTDRPGDKFLRLTSTVVRNASGKLRGLGLRLRDISIDARLQEAQRMESLGVLAGGIAHDFNNLLTVVNGHAELMLARVPANDAIHQSAEAIQQAGQQAADLTKRMLAYAGRGQIEAEILPVTRLIDQTVGVVRHGISKDVTIAVDFKAEPVVLGDASQLRQVVMNLVQNGAEAIGDRPGSVEIEVHRTMLTGEEDLELVGAERLAEGRYVIVQIRDNGSGIEPADLPRIFDPFYTTKFAGRGLGLSAVLGIIRGHQGALRVRSTVGEGSEFTIFLPWREASRVRFVGERSKISAPGSPDSSGTVLVADDESMIRDLIEAALSRAGFRMLSARGGQEAISLYAEKRRSIDVVLVDLTMPEIGGEEVVTRIKELDPDQPVVVMSGHAESDVAERISGLGASSILLKPFLASEVVAAVRAVVTPA